MAVFCVAKYYCLMNIAYWRDYCSGFSNSRECTCNNMYMYWSRIHLSGNGKTYEIMIIFNWGKTTE